MSSATSVGRMSVGNGENGAVIMKRARDIDRSRNNNIDNFYFNYPDYTVTKSIDYLTLGSISPIYKEDIEALLKSIGFRAKRDVRIKDKFFKMKRTYKSGKDNATIEVFHGLKDTWKWKPMIRVKVHDPNREFLSFLVSWCKYNEIKPNISELELTFDCMTNDRVALFEFMMVTLYMKNQNKKSGLGTIRFKPFTFYTCRSRKATRRGKIYFKDEGKCGCPCLRFEVTLKKHPILKKGLEFLITDIDNFDLSRLFQFSRIDEEAITEHINWKHRRRFKQLEKEGRYIGIELLKAHIKEWVRGTVAMKDSFIENWMELKSEKEMVPQHSRFRKVIPFHQDFIDHIQTGSFLPSRGI